MSVIQFFTGSLIIQCHEYNQRIMIKIFDEKSRLATLSGFRQLLETLEGFLTDNSFTDQEAYQKNFINKLFPQNSPIEKISLFFNTNTNEHKYIILHKSGDSAYIPELEDYEYLKIVTIRSKNYLEKKLKIRHKDYFRQYFLLENWNLMRVNDDDSYYSSPSRGQISERSQKSQKSQRSPESNFLKVKYEQKQKESNKNLLEVPTTRKRASAVTKKDIYNIAQAFGNPTLSKIENKDDMITNIEFQTIKFSDDSEDDGIGIGKGGEGLDINPGFDSIMNSARQTMLPDTCSLDHSQIGDKYDDVIPKTDDDNIVPLTVYSLAVCQ